MRKTQTIGLMAIVILACAVAAIPIDPNPGTGGSVPLPAAPPEMLSPQEPAQETQSALLPLAGLLAAVGALYALSVSKTQQEAAPDEASLARYQSMMDATKKKLADLESRVVGCRNRLIWARQRSSTSWEARNAASLYDKLLSDIKETKGSLSTLDSWGADLKSLEFRSDSSIRFRGQTYYYSSGLVRKITADEAYRRFGKAAEAAYNEFCSSMQAMYAYLQNNIAAQGSDLVDAVLEALDSAQKAFMQKLKDLREEYLTDQGSLQGQWKIYLGKLNDNYFRPFCDESKDLLEKLTTKTEETAYEVLTPLSVKLEIERQEREALKDEKERMHDRKRRWSMQLRDRVKRASKQVLKDFSRLYDPTVFSSLKTKVDLWRNTALDDARRMKWQRTLAKAEARCQEIDVRITGGRTDFLALAHQKTVAAVTAAFYAPKAEAAAPKKTKTSGTRVVKAKKRSPAVTVTEAPKTVLESVEQSETSWTYYPGVTTTTPTTTASKPFDLWTWLTEEQDRSGALGSDIFRTIGGNILGRGALDLLLGVYVKDDGSVTTTRLDTILNITVVAGPILRTTALGAKLCTWVSKTFVGAAKAAVAFKASEKLGKLASITEKTSASLLKIASKVKSLISSAKIKAATASKYLRLPTALTGKLDDILKLTESVTKLIGGSTAKILTTLTDAKKLAVEAEKFLSTLSKPYGAEKILGSYGKSKSVTKYLSGLGKSRKIAALYGGLNASYTRSGLSGLVKATVGRPFAALMDAGKIVAGKIPKPIKSAAADLLSDLGLSSANRQKLLSVLKGFDDAATLRSAAYGNTALEAASSYVKQIDTATADIRSGVEKVLTGTGQEVVSQEMLLIEKAREFMYSLPWIGGTA
jgi:DNA-binding transcriptional ArsR family regulator